MGYPVRNLYITDVGLDDEQVLLSSWKPSMNGKGEYCYPLNAPMGLDMRVPNFLGITKEDGVLPVKIVESKEETGLWLWIDSIEKNQIILNYNPGEHSRLKTLHDWSIPVWTDIKLEEDDEPIPITLAVKLELSEYNNGTGK